MPVRRRRRTIWIVAVSLAVLAALAAAAAVVVPWVVAETEAVTADGLTPVVLQRDGDEIAFTPADGWVVHPRFASESTVDLVTPDRAVTIELELVPEAAEAALTKLMGDAADTPASMMPGAIDASGPTAAADASGTDDEDGAADTAADPREPIRVETLASGLELRHVAAEHGLLAVVGTSAGSVALTVRAGSSIDLAEYRTALADLLETIRAE